MDGLLELMVGVQMSISPIFSESSVNLSNVLFLFDWESSGVLKFGEKESVSLCSNAPSDNSVETCEALDSPCEI